MKAVNLIPDEQRRGAGGSAGRSGGVAYAVVGVLAGLVAMVAVYSMTNKTISTRKAQVASLTAQVAASTTKSANLSQYQAAAASSHQYVTTVTGLAGGRFDWAHALNEIPRVLPHDVWLESMSGAIAPAATSSGITTTGVGGEPSIDIQGCTTSQNEVAKLITALHQIDNVDQVNLTKSDKSDTPNLSKGSCNVKTSYPAFDVTVSFKAPTDTTASSSTSTPAATTTPATTATPAATTTPSSATPATATPSSGSVSNINGAGGQG